MVSDVNLHPYTEGAAGTVVIKSFNRVLGTVAGASLGWCVLKIVNSVGGGDTAQQTVGSILVGRDNGGGNFSL